MGIADVANHNVRIARSVLTPDDLKVTGDGEVRFEEHVICGSKVHVVAEGRDIVVGARAWIGDNAVVRANIGANSIVTANSVVSEDVPANVVAVGSPAKRVWQVC